MKHALMSPIFPDVVAEWAAAPEPIKARPAGLPPASRRFSPDFKLIDCSARSESFDRTREPWRHNMTKPAFTGSGTGVFAFGIFSYAIFFAVFLYGIGFIGGFFTPTTLDGAPTGPVGKA